VEDLRQRLSEVVHLSGHRSSGTTSLYEKGFPALLCHLQAVQMLELLASAIRV